MHLRISTKRKDGNTYQYVQIVESFRRDDGLPAQRVLANLGVLTEQEIANLRVALQASRQGTALVLPGQTAQQEWQARIVASLSYLALAVALETWDRWKLPGLFNRLLPQGNEAVPPAAIIAALVLHRCTDPGSKLYAQRWFPRTALPELLGVDPAQFGNTRIHRVLESLDRIDPVLQVELPQRYRSKDGAFAAIFMDVTDAWFAGRGPDLAERSLTKEGLTGRHKIGIVLVCNEHGYPLRWRVVPGKRNDTPCMTDMLAQIQSADWLGDTPLVCDRAMGHGRSVATLLDSGVRFITAASRDEIASYTDALPTTPFLDLHPLGTEETSDGEAAAAARTAEQAGLQKYDDRTYFCDLGIGQRTLCFDRPQHQFSGVAWDPDELEGGASFLALARIFADRLHKRQYRHRSDLARKEGMTRARVTQIMNTLRLDPTLQEQLLAGDFGYVPERLLRQCAQCDTEAQQRALLEENARIMRPTRRPGLPPRRVGHQKVSLRLVAYFVPHMFVDQRSRLARRRQRMENFVAAINRRLETAATARDRYRARLEVHRELARWALLSLFKVRMVAHHDPRSDLTRWQMRLIINEAEWTRRLRFAGFVLLVAHPDLPHSAADMVRLYRQKDIVEKDFQTIKHIVKLRPLFHHTDAKVRAHVTLCMLALLLERSLERKLRRTGLTDVRSAAACFEELRGCHLNLITSGQAIEPTYAATEPTQNQRAILSGLRMGALIEPENIMERIKWRRK